MSDIEQAYIQTYESRVRHLAQQGVSRIRPYVEEVHEQSESHNFETLEQYPTKDDELLPDDREGVQEKTTRLQITPDVRPVFQKRRSLVATFDHGTSTEQEDIVQVLIDPNSNMAMAQAMAMKRKIDDLIISKMFADMHVKGAEEVEVDPGGVATFPASQIIGDGTAPISFDLVTEITELYLTNDIDPDIRKTIFIGPTQMRKLLQITEATNADYVSAKALSGNGYISNWMGFDWVVSTRLNIPLVDEIDCFVCTDKALGLHVCRDISTKVAEDPSVSFAWRIYSFMTMDLVRIEDKQLVRLHLADTL